MGNCEVFVNAFKQCYAFDILWSLETKSKGEKVCMQVSNISRPEILMSLRNK